jgi:murein DD-endopeptidase MepM/ murein hydrolase activator NlpD
MVIRNKRVSNTFGKNIRIDPQTQLPKDHDGWDIACFVGSEVYAVLDGTVEMVHQSYGGYGKTIILAASFKGKTYYLLYGHLSTISVTKGQRVTEGQTLGRSGQSGNANGQHHGQAHLHFEVRASLGGGAVDPSVLFGSQAVYETIKSDISDAINAGVQRL